MSEYKKSGRTSCARLILLTILFSFALFFDINAQINNYAEIGKPCPGFMLKNIDHFATHKASLKSFSGKWLLLYFWTSDCVACVEGFPKLNLLSKQFKDSVQFILVGRDHLIYGSGTKRARLIYERVRKKINLDIPIAYDTVLFRRFSIPGPGYAVWIDDKGIVRARTLAFVVNEKNMEGILNGNVHGLAEAPDMETRNNREAIINYHKPFLVNGNGGNDSVFLYRSILSAWTPDMEQLIIDFKKESHWPHYIKNGIQFYGANLSMLYRIAYHGTSNFYPGDSLYENYWPDVILETKDSIPFSCDFSTGYHFYCYSIIVPAEKATTSYLQTTMKDDLRRYFGYSVKLEIRKMPCWNLVCTDQCRNLLTKGGPSTNNYRQGTLDAAGFHIQNQPVNALIERIFNYQQAIPIIDQTHIAGNIDIDLDAMMTDMIDIKKELLKNGMDLIRGEKEMNVIVISDN